MNPTALIHAALQLKRSAALSAWDLCSVLTRQLWPSADVLAVSAAGSMLQQGLQAMIEPDRLLWHPRSVVLGKTNGSAANLSGRIDLGGFPDLGDSDHDETAVVRPWPASAPAQGRRVRRIDTLYADSHRIGLMAFATDAAPTILRGAHRVLATQRPMILLDLGTIAPDCREDFLEQVVDATGNGYCWHDSLALPLHDAGCRAAVLTLCAEQLLFAQPIADGCMRTVEGVAPALGPVIHRVSGGPALAALAWRGWRDPFVPKPVRGIVANFDDNLPTTGFHRAETDGAGSWWRWTGPNAHSAFALPIPGAGIWRLRLMVLAWGAVGGPDGIQIWVGGQRLSLCGTAQDMVEFSGIAIGPGVVPELLSVDLLTRETRQASATDPRRIGVCLLSASLLADGD